MNEEEKKDNSAWWINYRTDHAERELERKKKSVNEETNKAKGKIKAEIGDESSGKRKSLKELAKEAEERKNLSAVEKYTGRKPDSKDLHLKSTTALTDPETAKQNLKDASKAKNFGKEIPPSRGSGFRGGGSPMMREPDEVIKEKHKTTNPEDILSKKSKEKSFLLAMNEEKKPAIVNRKEKAPQQRFKEEQKEQHKAAQERLEQKQKLQAKSFKPAPAKDVFDRLPKKSEKTSSKSFKPAPTPDVFVKKASPQKNVTKSETPAPTPAKTARRSRPAGTGRIKR